MSLDKCKSANWEDYGNQEAMEGLQNSYTRWLGECHEYGIIPDEASYSKGYKKGITNFCTFQNGYLIGNDGKQLSTFCPIEAQETFTKGYIEGKRSFDSKVALDQQARISQEARQQDLNFRERMLGVMQGSSCRKDDDCKTIDKCTFDKCEKNGKFCTNDSGCTVSGSCNHNKCGF
jgi:hypothetical protein